MDFAERFTGSRVKQIHQVRIIFLLKMVQGFPDEPVGVQLAAKLAEFVALTGTQQGIGNALSAAEAGDNAADGRDLYLCRGVSHQKNFAVADSPLHRNPFTVDRNARALPFDRFHVLLLQELLDALLGCLAAAFTANTQRPASFVFRDQPIKISWVVGYEPHQGGVWTAICRKPDDGLN